MVLQNIWICRWLKNRQRKIMLLPTQKSTMKFVSLPIQKSVVCRCRSRNRQEKLCHCRCINQQRRWSRFWLYLFFFFFLLSVYNYPLLCNNPAFQAQNNSKFFIYIYIYIYIYLTPMVPEIGKPDPSHHQNTIHTINISFKSESYVNT